MALVDFTVTLARPDDLREVSNLVNSAYRGDSSRKGWTTEADFLDGQRTDPKTLASELTATPSRAILCLRRAGEATIIGCVFLERFEVASGVGCYLGMLTVQPTAQAQGLGRFLLAKAEEHAKSWGASKISLNVIHLRESLMAWYERRGYAKTGKTKPFPYGIPEAGAPKRDDLHFIVFEKRI